MMFLDLTIFKKQPGFRNPAAACATPVPTPGFHKLHRMKYRHRAFIIAVP
jgi:hypothetical protein